MDLARHTDQPTALAVAGEAYEFSELSIEGLGKLQAWIKQHTPHPIEAVKPHLKGLEPADRAALLEGARKAALHWPPEIGTAEGAEALLGTEAGRAEALFVALQVHQPQMTRDTARLLLKWLQRHDPTGMGRIFRVAFGLPEPPADEDEGDDAPKA